MIHFQIEGILIFLLLIFILYLDFFNEVESMYYFQIHNQKIESYRMNQNGYLYNFSRLNNKILKIN